MDLLVPEREADPLPLQGRGAPTGPCMPVGKVAEDAVWSYPEPLEDAPPLAGYLAFYWDRMDEWLEEDEPAIVHARDPYHRVDVLDTSRHVRVSVNGEVVAETTRGRGAVRDRPADSLVLPPRGRATRPDDARRQPYRVRLQGLRLLLVASGRRTTSCGRIPSRSARPSAIRDHLAFFNERVDIEVDGELEERPVTQWSRQRQRLRAEAS